MDEKHYDTHERHNRFSEDARLRKYGWRIVSRPSRGEAIWENEGVRKTESEAMDSVRKWEESGART